jgi:hypothetical protein
VERSGTEWNGGDRVEKVQLGEYRLASALG